MGWTILVEVVCGVCDGGCDAGLARVSYSPAMRDSLGFPTPYSPRHVQPTNVQGSARLDDMNEIRATATLSNLAAVRSKLKPRWKRPRKAKDFGSTGDSVRFVHLRQEDLTSIPLEAGKPTYIVLTPVYRCNEVVGAHFDFGRSFVRSSAFPSLIHISKALREDDDRKGMIFGHTDLSGSEALNKELSERRGKAVYALLTHDSDAWEQLFSGTADGPNWKEKWDVEEAQHMLNAIGCADDSGGPLKEDGIRGTCTKQAIHRFQAGKYPNCPPEQKPLARSDTLGKDGRKELFLAYAKQISEVPVDKERLSNVGGAKYMGCGEFNPRNKHAGDEESRRTMVLVFESAAEPQDLPCKLRTLVPCKSNCVPPTEEEGPDKSAYRCKVYREIARCCARARTPINFGS